VLLAGGSSSAALGTVRGVPELPEGLAALVSELKRMGFELEREEWHPWPGGGDIQLRRRRTRGVKRVRMAQDRGPWDLDVQIGRGWYEPFTALLALDERPHQQRALSHAERHAATVELVRRFTGSRAQRQAIKKRAGELSRAYTRWAEGKGEFPPT
jgi:hypothetical protein